MIIDKNKTLELTEKSKPIGLQLPKPAQLKSKQNGVSI